MAFRSLLKLTPKYAVQNSVRTSSLYVPDYLILAKTKTPEYDLVNVQMKGYDFAILDQYVSYVVFIASGMELNINNIWATPAKKLKIHTFQPKSTLVSLVYTLNLYERNVQIMDPKGHEFSIFMDAVITSCPSGVKLSIHEHTKEMQMERYIPDLELLDLKARLQEMYEKKK